MVGVFGPLNLTPPCNSLLLLQPSSLSKYPSRNGERKALSWGWFPRAPDQLQRRSHGGNGGRWCLWRGSSTPRLVLLHAGSWPVGAGLARRRFQKLHFPRVLISLSEGHQKARAVSFLPQTGVKEWHRNRNWSKVET